MISTGSLRTIVGIMGNVISFFLFLSPVPTFIKIWKAKTVMDFKSDPYIATLLNCLMWMLYGLPIVHPDSTLILTINGIGLFVESVYISVFFIYSDNKKRKRIILLVALEIIFVAVVAVITLYLFKTTKKRSMFVGILAMVFNVGMYVSPLTVMGMVIRTKSVKYMPLTLTVFSLLNGFVWMAYALLQFDINVLIPNGLGCIAGVAQIILYCYFYKTTNWDEDEKAPAQKVQLSEI